jgi:hypothetical protein
MSRFILLTLLATLSACDSGNNNAKTPEQIQAEIEASQKAFKENQQRIEAERKAREAQLIKQQSYISARFLSVSDEFIDVELSNNTGKDIDNIVGSLEVVDNQNKIITSVALTNWVPGNIYLPKDGTTLARKSLKLERPENRPLLIDNAANNTYRYTTLRIQFVGEDEISYLDPAPQPSPVTKVAPAKETIKEIKPVNQANPEACASNQVTLQTKDEYYPGPKCEHISRNMDSERFKVEYINMCKSELGITDHLPSVARVQIASCILETDRPGLFYSKRICCDKP